MFRYLFYITPLIMLCSLIQETGVTIAEIRQAYLDQNFLRIIKTRLSVKLINDYVIFIAMVIYLLKLSTLDGYKKELSGK